MGRVVLVALAAVIVLLACSEIGTEPNPGAKEAVLPPPPAGAQFTKRADAFAAVGLGECHLEWSTPAGVRQVPFLIDLDELPESDQNAFLVYRGWEDRGRTKLAAVVTCRFPYTPAGLKAAVDRVEERLSPGINQAGSVVFGLPALVSVVRWVSTLGQDECQSFEGETVCEIDGVVAEVDQCGPGAIYDDWLGCQCNTGDPDNYPNCGSSGGGGGSGGSGGGDSGDAGGGGGSDGSNTAEDENLTDTEIEDLCRPEETNCDPRADSVWTAEEVSKVDNAISLVNQNCPDLGSILETWRGSHRIYLWDGRVNRGGTLRGRVDPLTQDIYVWTGYSYDPSLDGSKPINWAETLAHEAQHVLEVMDGVDLDHNAIRARAATCAGV